MEPLSVRREIVNSKGYFIYVRKSSESEERQVQSLDDQVNYALERAKALKIKVIQIFKETKSAKEPYKRPLFENMVKRIENGEANGIICWHMNRLSRNPVDSGKIQYLLQKEVIKS